MDRKLGQPDYVCSWHTCFIIRLFYISYFNTIVFASLRYNHTEWNCINYKAMFCFPFSALIKQVNKSIDGTADDEDEGVPTDQAIRAGLELLKASIDSPGGQWAWETLQTLLLK